MEQRYLPQEKTIPAPEIQGSLLPQQTKTSEAEGVTHTLDEQEIATEDTTLTTLLQQEVRARQKETYLGLAWAGVFLAAIVWLVNLPITSEHSLKMRMLLCLVLMVAAGLRLYMPFYPRSYRRQKSLTDALSRIHDRDRKQLRQLIQTLKVQSRPVRNPAKQSLIKLLPDLQASDAPLLGEGERKILLSHLAISPNDKFERDLKELFSKSAYRRDMELSLAILKALEQVGGEQELPTVERLALGKPMQNNFRVPEEIQQAARVCLPLLANARRRPACQRTAASRFERPCHLWGCPVTPRNDPIRNSPETVATCQ